MTNKSFYEKFWKYGGEEKTFGPASRHVRRLVLKMIQNLQFKDVLDAGCGVGTVLGDINHHYSDKKISGVEYTPDAVQSAKNNLPSVEISQLDLSKNYLKKRFDLVTCIDVLEHIHDDVSVLKNLKKMTKKYLLLVVPTGPLFEKERVGVGHVHGYSKSEIVHKLRDSGFKIVNKLSWGLPFYNIYRRLVMQFPHDSLTKKFDLKKKFFSNLIYFLFFFNIPNKGERFFVLCRV